MSAYSALNNLINIQLMQREHLCPAQNNKDKKGEEKYPGCNSEKRRKKKQETNEN